MTITRAGLVARLSLPQALAALGEAAAWLADHGCVPVIDADSARAAGLDGQYATAPRDRVAGEVQVLLAFGGDGTLLEVANIVAQGPHDTPILGVNLGRLGFLTEVGRDGMTSAFEALVDGRTSPETRLLVTGRVVGAGGRTTERLALNDIVVTRGALSRMIEVDVTVDGQFLCHVKADGIIVATATGSTAYNLSAGGPIVHPAVDALVLTPIAPHTLTNRPLVLPATATIALRPDLDAHADVVATFDGQFGAPLGPGDVVEISRASRVLRLLRTSTRTHFDMLREKLRWGG